VALLFVPLGLQGWARWTIAGYAVIRVTEILVFQFNSQVYGGYPGKEHPRLHYTVVSYRRSILLAGLLYLESALWFATLYRRCPGAFTCTNVPLSAPLKALYFSVVTITTLGYGDVAASTNTGFLLVMAEALSGLFMTLGILARVVSYLPRPETLDPIEKAPRLPEA